MAGYALHGTTHKALNSPKTHFNSGRRKGRPPPGGWRGSSRSPTPGGESNLLGGQGVRPPRSFLDS